MFQDILKFIDKNDKIIGILHLLFAIGISTYGIFFSKNMFDSIYIIFNILILISWTFYNGECFLTYYIKKMKDKTYIAGTESTDINDMYLAIGSKEIAYIFVTISVFLNMISLYLVLKRNSFPDFIYILLPIMHLLYTLSLRIQHTDLYKNKLFLTFQEIFKYYFIVCFIYIFVFLCRKFIN